MARKTLKRTKVVYLAYTHSEVIGQVLMAVYSKTSYQTAYNWIADIAERHGVGIMSGDGSVAVMCVGPTGQTWWLERREVL